MAEHTMPKAKTKTVTIQGIELTVDPNAFDDLEVLELLELLEPVDGADPNALAFAPFARKVLGSQYKKVKDALRNANGRIPMGTITDFVQELMSKIAPNS